MKYFILSDIHIDFYSVQTRNYDTVLPNFEEIYQKNFLPAEGLICAGDIANDYYTQVMFYKFLKTKYKQIYIVFGNHDLVVSGGTIGNGNPFKHSEEKISAVEQEFKNDPQIHILNSPQLVNGFGGCMGMCDCTYPLNFIIDKLKIKTYWGYQWFDGRHWNYMHNDFDKIWNHYDKLMDDITKQQPKVMITHFCPLEMGHDPQFTNDVSSNYFYFTGKKYLDNMPNDSYWICGHTHTAFKTDYTNSNGNVIHIICNPLGYPQEDPYYLSHFSKSDFIVEL